MAWAWDRLVPVRRDEAVANLLASGVAADRAEARRLARAVGRHLALLVLELPGLVLSSAAALRRRVLVTGQATLVRDVAAGRGVVVAMAHLGNWEVVAAAARIEGVPAVMVVRPPRGSLARAAIGAVRRRLGLHAVGERGALKAALAALAAGRAVGIVVDQRPSPRRALPGTFLGRAAALSTVAARVAVLSGAPVYLALTFRREDGTHAVEVAGPLDASADVPAQDRVAALTREIAERVETAVRAHPDQWLWLHRRWKPVATRRRTTGHD